MDEKFMLGKPLSKLLTALRKYVIISLLAYLYLRHFEERFMKKNEYTFAVMPSSGHRMRTFSLSAVSLIVLAISLAVIVISSITFGSLATWKYCKKQREKAEEAVQNAGILHKELEIELQKIKKSYTNFKNVLDVDTESDSEQDDKMGKGGPEMPELFDIPVLDLYSVSERLDDAGIKFPPVLLESISLRADINELIRRIDDKIVELSTTPSIWPVKFEPREQLWISSGFRRRKSPFTGRWEMHAGVDIPGPSRTPIIATADGTITKIGSDRYLGNYIEVYHSEEFSTLYGHMRSFAKGVKKGTKVKRGGIIGYMGRTGKVTGMHVHYEVKLKGKSVNPVNYILD
jgi:murein DD-endopeptidase MepM/ murein hydrolase activator NlpD